MRIGMHNVRVCTCTYLLVPIFARYPSIHRPIQPVSHAESTVLNVKLKGNILSHEHKKEERAIDFAERNTVYYCEHGKLAAFDIWCVYAARRCLFVNQFVFVSFLFFCS